MVKVKKKRFNHVCITYSIHIHWFFFNRHKLLQLSCGCPAQMSFALVPSLCMLTLWLQTPASWLLCWRFYLSSGQNKWGFPGGASGKEPACQSWRQMQIPSLGQEDPLEEGMATHSSILAWRIPWTEEPGGLQNMWSQRVKHDWIDLAQDKNTAKLMPPRPSCPQATQTGVVSMKSSKGNKGEAHSTLHSRRPQRHWTQRPVVVTYSVVHPLFTFFFSVSLSHSQRCFRGSPPNKPLALKSSAQDFAFWRKPNQNVC